MSKFGYDVETTQMLADDEVDDCVTVIVDGACDLVIVTGAGHEGCTVTVAVMVFMTV